MDAYRAYFNTNQDAGSQPAQNHASHGASADHHDGEGDRGLGSFMKKFGGKEDKEGKKDKEDKEGKEEKDGEDKDDKKKGKASKIMKLGMKA